MCLSAQFITAPRAQQEEHSNLLPWRMEKDQLLILFLVLYYHLLYP